MAAGRTQNRAPKRARVTAKDGLSYRTIEMPPEMDAEIVALVGEEKFSEFARQAFAHELQRESIAVWLDERELARGRPVSRKAIEFAEAAWRSRK